MDIQLMPLIPLIVACLLGCIFSAYSIKILLDAYKEYILHRNS